MTKLEAIANHWPLPVAALFCGALVVTMAVEKVDLPDWLIEAFEQDPEEPTPTPQPKAGAVPYAPAPGRDDRTPIAFLSQVFDLGDATLPSKLTGVGPVLWDHAGQGTGAMIAPDVVLTTGHLFAERGKWDGPHGRSEKPPAPSDGRIYLAVCGRAYDFKAIELGTMAPRARLGLDYAIAVLAEPVCDAAQVLPVSETPDNLAGAEDQILLNMGSYRFGDIDRYAQHPLYAARPTSDKFARYDVFGVRCRATGRESTGDVDGLSTGLVITSGCDGVPGGSGGPLLASRDGGISYSVVGVANSYRPSDSEYNNYTAVEGAFAAHLARLVDLGTLPEAKRSTSPALQMSDSATPVLPMDLNMKEIEQ